MVATAAMPQPVVSNSTTGFMGFSSVTSKHKQLWLSCATLVSHTATITLRLFFGRIPPGWCVLEA